MYNVFIKLYFWIFIFFSISSFSCNISKHKKKRKENLNLSSKQPFDHNLSNSNSNTLLDDVPLLKNLKENQFINNNSNNKKKDTNNKFEEFFKFFYDEENEQNKYEKSVVESEKNFYLQLLNNQKIIDNNRLKLKNKSLEIQHYNYLVGIYHNIINSKIKQFILERKRKNLPFVVKISPPIYNQFFPKNFVLEPHCYFTSMNIDEYNNYSQNLNNDKVYINLNYNDIVKSIKYNDIANKEICNKSKSLYICKYNKCKRIVKQNLAKLVDNPKLIDYYVELDKFYNALDGLEIFVNMQEMKFLPYEVELLPPQYDKSKDSIISFVCSYRTYIEIYHQSEYTFFNQNGYIYPYKSRIKKKNVFTNTMNLKNFLASSF